MISLTSKEITDGMTLEDALAAMKRDAEEAQARRRKIESVESPHESVRVRIRELMDEGRSSAEIKSILGISYQKLGQNRAAILREKRT